MNHPDQLIHHRRLILFFNSFKLLLSTGEFVGDTGTGRSQLHNKPQTLQTKEQRAASNYSHPDESVAVHNFHQVSWEAQKPSPTAKASLSFHLVKCQLRFMLMTKPGIFQFEKENFVQEPTTRENQSWKINWMAQIPDSEKKKKSLLILGFLGCYAIV